MLARAAACVGVSAVVGAAWLGPAPVSAQTAGLPTQIPGLPDPLAPPQPGTTTTTLLPPLEQVVPPPSQEPAPTPPPTLLPAPAPGPGASPLPLPVAAPAPAPAPRSSSAPPTVRRSTITDIPVVRRPGPAGFTRAGPLTAVAGTVVEREEGFEEALPFADTDTASRTASGEMELGVADGSSDAVRNMASAAGGLMSVVLLGVVLWLRRQAHAEPQDL